MNSMENRLKQKLNNLEIDAPGIDWNSFQTKKQKRRAFWFLRRIVAVFLLLGLGGSVLFIWNNNHQKSGKTIAPVAVKKENNRKLPISKNQLFDTSELFTGNNISSSGDLTASFVRLSAPVKGDREIKIESATPVTDIHQIFNFNSNSIDDLLFFPLRNEPVSVVLNPVRTLKNEIGPPKNGFRNFTSGLLFQARLSSTLNRPSFTVTSAGRAFIHKDYEGIRRSSEQGITGFTAQVGILKKSGHWIYGIGLGYSLTEISARYDFIYSEKPIIDINGRIDNYAQTAPENVKFSSIQKITFTEVPLTVQYQFRQLRHGAIGVQTSVIPQFLSSLKGELPNAVLLDHRETLKMVNYKNSTAVWELGLPLSQRFKGNSGLSVMPYYRFNTGFDQARNFYRTRLNSWGLSCSYIVGF